MKTHLKIAFVSAIALATLASCNKEKDVNNPNYNKATGEVLTSFVFNVAATNTPMTKQTAENTQAIPAPTVSSESWTAICFPLSKTLQLQTANGFLPLSLQTSSTTLVTS